MPADASSCLRLELTAPAGVDVLMCTTPYDLDTLGSPTAGVTTADVWLEMPDPVVHSLLTLSSAGATINGVDVTTSFSNAGVGQYVLTMTTSLGDETWPWTGMEVSLTLEDPLGTPVAVVDAARLVPGSEFIDVSVALGMRDFGKETFTAQGLCSGDVNDDGAIDVFVAFQNDLDQLWLNNGNGSFFTEVAAAWGLASSRASGSCGFADIDGVGGIDLVVSGFDDDDVSRIYINNGTGFVDEGPARNITGDRLSQIVVADVDGDNWIDVFECRRARENLLLMNNPSGVFTNEGAERGLGTTATRICFSSAFFDADGDSDLDLAVINYNSKNEFYYNDGSGSFSPTSTGFDDTKTSTSIVVADISGDGILDLYVSRDNLRDLLYIGTGVYAPGVAPFVEEGEARGLALSTERSFGGASLDLTLSGKLDLVIGVASSFNYVYRNDGTGNFSLGIDPLAPTASSGGLAVDLDGIGGQDLLFPRSGLIYFNIASNGAPTATVWVAVRPLTGFGTPSAFGAIITLTCESGCGFASGWVGVRSSCGGSGYRTQQGYDSFFGVPEPDGVYTLTVDWPANLFPRFTRHGIVPSALAIEDRLIVVEPRPVVEDVTISTSAPPLRVGSNVSVTLSTANNQSSLLPGSGCCFVNGVDVTASFVDHGNGMYGLEYTAAAGDDEWAAGGLRVTAPLRYGFGQNYTSDGATVTVANAPAGDPVPPVISFVSAPRRFHNRPVAVFDIRCATEAGPLHGCTFFTAVSASASSPPVNVTVTSDSSIDVTLGYFIHEEDATFTVHAVDWAGNPSVGGTVTHPFTMDLTIPDASIASAPAQPVDADPDASFLFDCSEDICVFEYSLDDAVMQPLLSGNGTGDGSSAAYELGATRTVVVETSPTAIVLGVANDSLAVARCTPETQDNVTFSVSVDGAAPVVVTAASELELQAVWRPVLPLSEGRHTVRAAATICGMVDVTPVEEAFLVDTKSPAIRFVLAPVSGDVSDSPLVSVAASEPDVTFMWRSGPTASITDAPWNRSTTGLLSVQGIRGGEPHTILVRAVDASGLPAVAELNRTWVPGGCPVDSLPQAPIRVLDVRHGSGHAAVVFESSDSPAGGFEYQLVSSTGPDPAPWLPTTSSSTLLVPNLLPGPSELYLRPVIPGVCFTSAPASALPSPTLVAQWDEPHRDLPPPTVVSGPPATTPSVFAVFGLELPFLHPGPGELQYAVDDVDDWTPCESTLRVGPLLIGDHSLHVRSADADGGASLPTTYSWTITSSGDDSILVLPQLEDGEHTLDVIAIDRALNQRETPTSHSWRIDTQPPIPVINRTSDEFTTNATATFVVTCSGEVDPCHLCWSSETLPTGCVTGETVIHLTAPTDGIHHIALSATDSAGHGSEAPGTSRFTLDSTPPESSIESEFGPVVNSTTVAFNVTTSEAVSDVRVSTTPEGLDAVVFILSSTSAVVEVTVPEDQLVDGVTAVGAAVTSVDLAGNVETASTDPVTVLVDLAAPVVTGMTALPAATNSTRLRVHATASDGAGGGVFAIVMELHDLSTGELVQHVVESGASANLEATGLPESALNVSVYPVDVAGNSGPRLWQTTVVDTTAPTSSFPDDAPTHIASSVITIAVNSSEPDCTVFVRDADGGTGGWVTAGADGVVTLPPLPDGVHVLEALSVDPAGNHELAPLPTLTLVIDTVPPLLTAVDGDLLPRWTPSRSVSGCLSIADASSSVFVDAVVLPATAGLTVSVTSPVLSGTELWQSCVSLSARPGTVLQDELVEVNVTVSDLAELESSLAVVVGVDSLPPPLVVSKDLTTIPECLTSSRNNVTVCNAFDAPAFVAACDDVIGDAVSPCVVLHAVDVLQLTESECAAAAAAAAAAGDGDGGGGGGGGGSDPGGATRRLLRRLQTAAIDTSRPTPDGAEFNPLVPEFFDDAEFRVSFAALDAAGNKSPLSSFVFWVDTTTPSPPEVLSRPSSGVSSDASIGTVVVRAVDTSPGIGHFEYSVNGGPDERVDPVDDGLGANIELSGLTVGTQTVSVRYVDQAGFKSTPTLTSWTTVSEGEAPGIQVLQRPAAESGDVSPEFVVAAAWPADGTGPSSSGTLVTIIVTGGEDGPVEVCADVPVGESCTYEVVLTAPQLYGLSFRAVIDGTVEGPAETVAWALIECTDAEYAVFDPTTAAIQCLPCPSGAVCTGAYAAAEDLYALPGFYPSLIDDTQFYSCPRLDSCLGGLQNATQPDVVRGECDTGYTGRLCLVCDDGYYDNLGVCDLCPTGGSGGIVSILVAMLILGVAGAIVFFLHESLPIGEMKIGVAALQILGSAGGIGVVWPAGFTFVLGLFRPLLFDLTSVVRVGCAASVSFYATLIGTLVLFKAVLLLVVVVWLVKWRRQVASHATVEAALQRFAVSAQLGSRKSRVSVTDLGGAGAGGRRTSTLKKPLAGGGGGGGGGGGSKDGPSSSPTAAKPGIPWDGIFRQCFLVLFLAYSGVTLRIFKLFQCREVDGKFWIVSAIETECYTSEWWAVAFYAFAMAALYSFGLPVGIFAILYKNRKRLNTEAAQKRWGFLYSGYGRRAYLWECAGLIQRLMLANVILLFEPGSSLQLAFAVTVSFYSHTFLAAFKPFKKTGDQNARAMYRLSHASNIVITTVYLCGLLFVTNTAEKGTNLYSGLEWVMVVVCLLFVVAWVGDIYRQTYMSLRAARRARQLRKEKEGIKSLMTSGRGRGGKSSDGSFSTKNPLSAASGSSKTVASKKVATVRATPGGDSPRVDAQKSSSSFASHTVRVRLPAPPPPRSPSHRFRVVQEPGGGSPLPTLDSIPPPPPPAKPPMAPAFPHPDDVAQPPAPVQEVAVAVSPMPTSGDPGPSPPTSPPRRESVFIGGSDLMALPDLDDWSSGSGAANPAFVPASTRASLTPRGSTLTPRGALATTPSDDAVAPSADTVAPSADAVASSVVTVTPSADAVTPSADTVAPSADASADAANPGGDTPDSRSQSPEPAADDKEDSDSQSRSRSRGHRRRRPRPRAGRRGRARTQQPLRTLQQLPGTVAATAVDQSIEHY